MKFQSPFLALLAIFALFSCVLGQLTTSNGLVLTTITSGTSVQTLVLKTTVITSCPSCATGQISTPLAVEGASSGAVVRPAMIAVTGATVILSGLFFIFA